MRDVTRCLVKRQQRAISIIQYCRIIFQKEHFWLQTKCHIFRLWLIWLWLIWFSNIPAEQNRNVTNSILRHISTLYFYIVWCGSKSTCGYLSKNKHFFLGWVLIWLDRIGNCIAKNSLFTSYPVPVRWIRRGYTVADMKLPWIQDDGV